MAKLLIVDDLPDYLRSLSQALRSEFEIVTAQSLVEAQQRMDNTVDLALVDVRLSESEPDNRDGIVLLKWLKEHFPRVLVVIMSAYRDFEAAVDALNLGAAYFLKKPIDPREMRQLLPTLLTSAPSDGGAERARGGA